MHKRRSSSCSVLLALVAASVSMDAFADDTHECIVASNDGQVLRDAHKLVQASARFAVCARDVCPGLVRKACIDWRDDVATRLPTVVPSAQDTSGHDQLEVRVLVDGRVLVTQLDGSPVPLDPGPHLFRFEPARGEAVEQNIIVREGEKNRLVNAVLGRVAEEPPAVHPASTTPAAASGLSPSGVAASEVTRAGTSHRPWPVASIIFGGVGVAALASFTAFGLSGQAARTDLERTCAPSQTCDPGEVTSMRTKLVIADASLGVGLVTLGVSAYLFVTRPASRAQTGRLDSILTSGRMLSGWQGRF
jgi:hypothetical protein